MDDNKLETITINDKKNMINDVSTLTESQQIEIFNILSINNNDLKFTENKNGIFINIDEISDAKIIEIIRYISICKESNQLLNKNTYQTLTPPEPSNYNNNPTVINKSISKIIQQNSNEEQEDNSQKIININLNNIDDSKLENDTSDDDLNNIESET